MFRRFHRFASLVVVAVGFLLANAIQTATIDISWSDLFYQWIKFVRCMSWVCRWWFCIYGKIARNTTKIDSKNILEVTWKTCNFTAIDVTKKEMTWKTYNFTAIDVTKKEVTWKTCSSTAIDVTKKTWKTCNFTAIDVTKKKWSEKHAIPLLLMLLKASK